MSMSEETRREIDQLRETIRGIGATLKHLRQEKDALDRIKTGPGGRVYERAPWPPARVCKRARSDRVRVAVIASPSLGTPLALRVGSSGWKSPSWDLLAPLPSTLPTICGACQPPILQPANPS